MYIKQIIKSVYFPSPPSLLLPFLDPFPFCKRPTFHPVIFEVPSSVPESKDEMQAWLEHTILMTQQRILEMLTWPTLRKSKCPCHCKAGQGGQCKGMTWPGVVNDQEERVKE